MNRRIAPVLAIAFLAGSLVFGLVAHLTNPVLPEDDAYITYRYVDNLLNGKGLVYNPGQRVFGSSTPLYVAWLAGIRSVARLVPTPDLAVRANFVFYALTIVGICFLLTSLGTSVGTAALLAGLVSFRVSLLRASLGGMETFLFAGLLVWSLWTLVTRRFRLGAWLAGLSALARPEGVLMVVLFFASWLIERRHCPTGAAAADWREIIGLLLPGLAWVAFATPYFGTPIYHSILAKSRPLYPLRPGSALATLTNWLVLWMVGGTTLWPAGALTAVLLLVAVVLVVAALGYVRLLTPSPRGDVEPAAKVLLVPVLLAMFTFFYAVSNPLLFSWYLPPVELLWFASIATGVALAVGWLKGRGDARLTLVPVLGLVVLTSGPALMPLYKSLAAHRPLADLRLASDRNLARTMTYRETAEWLNRVAPCGDTLIAPEIGALGYYYHGFIYDACGLVSPEALPFLPVPDSERTGSTVGAISLGLVRHLRCDVVVTMQGFASRSLYPSAWYHENYELVKQFKLPIQFWGPGGDTIDVFFRRDCRALRDLRDSAATPDR